MTAAAGSSTGHTHCTRTATPTTTPNDSCTEGQGRGEGGEGRGEGGERIVGGGGLRETPMTIVHVNERCRKKQARSNKQQGKATQHTQASHFSEAASGGTRPMTLHTLDRALYHVYMYTYLV